MKHPETVRKFETNIVGLKLDPFKGVECLVTKEFTMISKATLLSLPALKELHYNNCIRVLFLMMKLRNEVDPLARVKRTLKEFIGNVKFNKGSDFRFTFVGFQLTSRAKVDAIDFGVPNEDESEFSMQALSAECFYMKNWQHIDPDATLDFICSLEYNLLMSHAPQELPWCVSQKFTRISCLAARYAVQDENHLLQFVKSQKILKKSELIKAKFSQEFYDQLASVGSLEELSFWEERENELKLNLDFISKFKRLIQLRISQDLSYESLTSLVKSLEKLEEGHFYLKRRWFSFEKIYNLKIFKVFKVDEKRQLVFETKNPDEFFSYCLGQFQGDTKSDAIKTNFTI